jgi:hypothetical protein
VLHVQGFCTPQGVVTDEYGSMVTGREKLTALLDMHYIQDLELTDITSHVLKKNWSPQQTVEGACLGNSKILLGKMAHVITLLTCI